MDKLNTKKNKKKAIILASLMLSVIAFLTVGYFMLQGFWNENGIRTTGGRQIPINQQRLASDIGHSGVEVFPVLEEEMGGGISLGVLEAQWDGNIQLETRQDLMTIQVFNTSFDEMNLLLKVFYNYEEIPFTNLGENSKDEFLFKLAGGYYAHIPIQLPENVEATETISKLTIGVFTVPEYFAASDSDLGFELRAVGGFFTSGMVLNFEINNGIDHELILSVPPLVPTTNRYENASGFTVHSNPEPPGDSLLWFFDESLVVTSGEEIELTFFANAPTDDYVIVSLLDWQQIPMNGQSYLWVTPQDNVWNRGQYETFVITAPDAPGFYEFVAFLVHQPTQPSTAGMFFPLEAVRFTIEVVE